MNTSRHTIGLGASLLHTLRRECLVAFRSPGQIVNPVMFFVIAVTLFPLGGVLHLDVEGNPEKVDVIYRFFELFDLENIPTWKFMLEAWEGEELVFGLEEDMVFRDGCCRFLDGRQERIATIG